MDLDKLFRELYEATLSLNPRVADYSLRDGRDVCGLEQDDIDAPVASAACISFIVRDGMKFGVASRSDSTWIGNIFLNEETGYACGAGCGELPVSCKLRCVNGQVVGMAFHAEGLMGERCGDAAKETDCLGPELRGP